MLRSHITLYPLLVQLSLTTYSVSQNLLNGTAADMIIQQDNFGNTTYQKMDNGIEVTETINTPLQTQCTWLPAHVSGTQVKTTRTGEPLYVRSKIFEYNGTGCQLTKVIGDEGVINVLMYDNQVGNIIASTVLSDLPTFSGAYGYDGQRRFVTSEVNILGHATSSTYDNAYGNKLSQHDLNGHVTNYSYDGFGRLKETTTSTNQKITILRAWDINTFPYSVYSITTSMPGTPTTKEYYDIIGNVLRIETQGFNGAMIFVNKKYNNLGQIVSASEPNDNSSVTAYTYETDFKRLKEVNSVGGAKTKYTYPYGTNTTLVEVTAANLVRNSSKTLDASGKTLSVTDEGGIISYVYHSCGKPKQITAPGGASTTMEYDSFGRQKKLIDPDAGETNYDYYKTGVIKSQTDAKGNRFDMSYDAMQRMIFKTGNDGSAVTYQYDDPNNGIGMIDKVISTSAIFAGINCDYNYDNQSRLASKTEQNIDGQNYTFNYQYDNLNRVAQITYPGGFGVKREYNSFGYLEKIKRVDNNNLIWVCSTMNQRLQITNALQGNGGAIVKSYDNLGILNNITRTENGNTVMNWNFDFNSESGNLDNRVSNLPIANNFLEEFKYDDLDRLYETKLNSIQSLNMSYAPNGNIAGKSDVGFYSYGPLPHAVAAIGAPSPELQASAQQDIVYNAFQKASVISESGLNLQFTYGPDLNRKISELKDNSNNSLRKIIYVGDYEKITDGGNSYEVHYIAGGDGLAAVYVVPPSGIGSMYYAHTDHLGSIIGIYDDNGQPIFTQSFDAWGESRDFDDWSTANSQAAPDWLIRGYTGHEHHREFGLINMNGRIYDPLLSRMLSPDNYVQATDFTQTFNRYSYAANNPLIYADPDGNFFGMLVWGGTFAVTSIFNIASGGSNPFGGAYNNANLAVNNASKAGQVSVYSNGNTRVTAGLNLLAGGVSANISNTQGGFTSSATVGIGPGGLFAGAGTSYTDGDWTVGVSGGINQNTNGVGYSSKLGLGGGYKGASLGLNYYGGRDAQFTWNAGYRNGAFSLSTENDAFLNFINGPNSDKYRTGALEFGLGNFRAGFSIYTNNPESDVNTGDSQWISRHYGKNASGKGSYVNGKRIFSAAYLGYNDGTTISRIGIDAPGIQDVIQNGLHQSWIFRQLTGGLQKGGSPYFPTDYGTPNGLYLYNSYYSPFSLY